jgi:predicted nucleotidyltransferase
LTAIIDEPTMFAVSLFLGRAGEIFPISGAILFGSRARGENAADSDADLPVLLSGPIGDHSMVTYRLGGLVFDVMMETGVEIQPVPSWDEEWAHPESYFNPSLLRSIVREGVRVYPLPSSCGLLSSDSGKSPS